MLKMNCILGVGRRRARWTGNRGTSACSSYHAKSSWRLKELTEGAVTIVAGSLFQYFTTRIEKDCFLRRRRLGPCSMSKGLPLNPGCSDGIKKILESRSNLSENTMYMVMKSLRRRRLRKECRPSGRSRSLYVVGENPLRDLSPTAGSAPNYRR